MYNFFYFLGIINERLNIKECFSPSAQLKAEKPIQTASKGLLRKFLQIGLQLLQIDFLKEYLMVHSKAFEIGIGPQTRIQVKQIQRGLFRPCNLIDVAIIGLQLIPEKKIRLDGTVEKIRHGSVKSAGPSCGGRRYTVHTFRDKLIIGKGCLERNKSRNYFPPKGNSTDNPNG